MYQTFYDGCQYAHWQFLHIKIKRELQLVAAYEAVKYFCWFPAYLCNCRNLSTWKFVIFWHLSPNQWKQDYHLAVLTALLPYHCFIVFYSHPWLSVSWKGTTKSGLLIYFTDSTFTVIVFLTYSLLRIIPTLYMIHTTVFSINFSIYFILSYRSITNLTVPFNCSSWILQSSSWVIAPSFMGNETML